MLRAQGTAGAPPQTLAQTQTRLQETSSSSSRKITIISSSDSRDVSKFGAHDKTRWVQAGRMTAATAVHFLS
jgi:hypothetical protein